MKVAILAGVFLGLASCGPARVLPSSNIHIPVESVSDLAEIRIVLRNFAASNRIEMTDWSAGIHEPLTVPGARPALNVGISDNDQLVLAASNPVDRSRATISYVDEANGGLEGARGQELLGELRARWPSLTVTHVDASPAAPTQSEKLGGP